MSVIRLRPLTTEITFGEELQNRPKCVTLLKRDRIVLPGVNATGRMRVMETPSPTPSVSEILSSSKAAAHTDEKRNNYYLSPLRLLFTIVLVRSADDNTTMAVLLAPGLFAKHRVGKTSPKLINTEPGRISWSIRFITTHIMPFYETIFKKIISLKWRRSVSVRRYAAFFAVVIDDSTGRFGPVITTPFRPTTVSGRCWWYTWLSR